MSLVNGNTDKPLGRSDLTSRLRRGGFFLASGRMLGMLAVVVIYAILARIAPTKDFAAFVLSLNLVTLISLVAMFGLNVLICRYIAAAIGTGDFIAARKAYVTTLRVAAVTVSVTGLVFWLVLKLIAVPVFQRPVLAETAGIIALWMVLLAVSQMLAEALRGHHKLAAFGMLGGISGGLITQALFLSSLATAYCFVPLTFRTVAWLAAASFVAPILLSAVWLHFTWRTSEQLAAQSTEVKPFGPVSVLSESFPLMLLFFTDMGLDRVGPIILGAYGTDAQVAVFEGVWRTASIGIIPLNLVNLAVASSISELHAGRDLARLERMLRGAATISSAAAIPVLMLMAVFGSPILSFTFGPAFAAGAPAMAILCAAHMVRVLIGPAHVTLMMTGHQLAALVCFLATLPLLLFAPWAVEHFGLVGIAVVIALSTTLPRIFEYAVVRVKLGVDAMASPSPRLLQDLVGTVAFGRSSRGPAHEPG